MEDTFPMPPEKPENKVNPEETVINNPELNENMAAIFLVTILFIGGIFAFYHFATVKPDTTPTNEMVEDEGLSILGGSGETGTEDPGDKIDLSGMSNPKIPPKPVKPTAPMPTLTPTPEISITPTSENEPSPTGTPVPSPYTNP